MTVTPAERLAFRLQRNGPASVDILPPVAGSDIAYLRATPAPGVLALAAFDATTGRVKRSPGTRHVRTVVMIANGGGTDITHPATLREFMNALAPHLPTVEVWHPLHDRPGDWLVYQIPASRPDLVEAARRNADIADTYAVSAWEYTAAELDGLPSWWQFI